MKNKRLGLKILLSILTLSLLAINIPFSIQAAPMGDTASFGDVLINEFVVTGTSDETIELYNTLGVAVNVTDWQIWHTTAGVFEIMGNITSEVVIPANGYVEINDSSTFGNMDDFTLSNSGDSLQLRDVASTIIDSVAYGVEGGAPNHPYGGSIARVATGGTDASDWNIDMSPTLLAMNDAKGVDLGGTDIVINEVNVDQHFVELYNTHSYEIISLDGWSMSGGTQNVLDLSGSINPGGFALFQDLSPGTYDFLRLQYYSDPDFVIHLYNSTGERVAQLGWNTNVDPLSWVRYPDGNTTGFNEDGWNNETSGFVPMSATPGTANADEPYIVIQDMVVNDTAIAMGDSVDVDVFAQYSNSESITDINGTVTVDLGGTPTALTYDAVSGYFNGTVDSTGYTPSVDSYGFYHTSELMANVTVGDDTTTTTSGVLINPGYDETDTVIMFDEGHEGYYSFSDYAPAAEWTSMLLETGVADYIIFLDLFDYRFRMSSEVFTYVDLLVVTSPDSDLVENWLLESEADAMVEFVEAGGSLWFSGEGGTYSDNQKNGLSLMTEKWGIEWFDGYYQDPVHNAGQDNHGIPLVAFPNGSTFDDFGAFGADEFYFNGMVINHSVQYTGATVTKVIAPRDGSNWDSDDAGYEPDMSPITHEYALAYLVENGSGEAFILGSSSLFGHYDDFQDGVESAQFALNVFCYLLNVSAVQFPTLTLVDSVGAQTVYNNNTAVTFSVDLSSSVAGATLSEVEVAGTIEGDLVEFTAAGGGVYTATWDATFSDAGTYTLEVSASAETAVGAMYIGAEIEISITVEEGTTETTTTTTTTTGSAPGFEMISVLLVLSVIGLAYIRRRR